MAISQEQANWFASSFSALAANIERVVFGKRHVIELALTTMVSQGHLLLEDLPGTGKTSLARAISQSISGVTTRIQFTPDLLPGDVTGLTVYDQKKGEFEFHAGPIFANVVLADEINRASPKTQSALLEAMEEGQVTIDGITRVTGEPFLVIATQNPIEQAGTYPLPEAQLDRFMMKTSLGYPDTASTIRILEATASEQENLQGIINLDGLVSMSTIARQVYVEPVILDYIARLVDATRMAEQVRVGVSVRGARALTRAAKTWAAGRGRAHVTLDDVKGLAVPVLTHRLVLDPEAEFDGVTAEAVIGQILLDLVPPERGVGPTVVAPQESGSPVSPASQRQTPERQGAVRQAPVRQEPEPQAPVRHASDQQRVADRQEPTQQTSVRQQLRQASAQAAAEQAAAQQVLAQQQPAQHVASETQGGSAYPPQGAPRQ